MFAQRFETVRTTRSTRTAGRPLAERLEDRRLMSTVVYADFDADGDVDGADYVTVRGDVDGADFLALRPGNGDGTFGAAQRVRLDGVQGRVDSVAAGDFNGDGQIDLLTAGTYGRGVNERGIIAILIGLAKGAGEPTGAVTFAEAQITETNPNVVKGEPVVGDWNGDGSDDVAFNNRQRGVLVALLLPAVDPDGTGDAASTSPPVDVNLLGIRALNVAAGDLNGDGLDDLAYIGGPNRSLHVLENVGAGVWDDTDVVHGYQFTDVLIGSVTDNGTEDLVVLRNGKAHTFEGDPQRLLGLMVSTSPIAVNIRSAEHIVLADVDGDGHLDLFSPVPVNRPFIAYGDGTGAFAR